jgi:hypothetical protein
MPVRSNDSSSDLESVLALSRIREKNNENKPRADYSGISVMVMNPTGDLTMKLHENS